VAVPAKLAVAVDPVVALVTVIVADRAPVVVPVGRKFATMLQEEPALRPPAPVQRSLVMLKSVGFVPALVTTRAPEAAPPVVWVKVNVWAAVAAVAPTATFAYVKVVGKTVIFANEVPLRAAVAVPPGDALMSRLAVLKPAVVLVGVKRAVTVQEPSGASEVQLLVTTANSVASVPLNARATVPVWALPVLVTVKAIVAETWPMTVLPKLAGLVATVSVAVVPVPVRADVTVPPGVALTWRLAVCEPVAVGL
jgi:hypothetical protein